MRGFRIALRHRGINFFVSMSEERKERIRTLLCLLQEELRAQVCAQRDGDQEGRLATVAMESAADTIYHVDKISEELILRWFAGHWPESWPVELVMEGTEERGSLTFPAGTPVERTEWKCLLDPIDGTRNLMYDKRSAWALAGMAPQQGPETSIAEIEIAAMTELPTSRHWRADQFSVVRGAGLIAEAADLRTGERTRFFPRPSSAADCRHGFASIVRFFPDGLGLLGALEEALWKKLYAEGTGRSPLVFQDQYLTTGGQLVEMIVGRDRFLADLRPLVFRKLGQEGGLCCHPYDLAALPVATEAGLLVEDPVTGEQLSAPMDTTTPVAWAAYANDAIAAEIRPVLGTLLEDFGLV